MLGPFPTFFVRGVKFYAEVVFGESCPGVSLRCVSIPVSA